MINIGIVGFGYWGPNIARNFAQHQEVKLSIIFDLKEESLKRAKGAFPSVKTTSSLKDFFSHSELDAVAICTPVGTHYELARQALEAGKHILVEKPFVTDSIRGEELINLAQKKNLVIMVDHTFLFTGAVKKIKELTDSATLGTPLYYDSIRVNLGLFQNDVNVIWDLAPHDLSIIDYLFNKKPKAVSATGIDHFSRNIENVAFLTVFYEDNLIAHLNMNWLSPVKIRQTLIGGTQKMLVWNDLESDEKIKVYDKGVDVSVSDNTEGIRKSLVDYRVGDIFIPKIDSPEALKLVTSHFLHCIKTGQMPLSDGSMGNRVTKILEAAQVSIKERGALTEVRL